MAGPNIPEGFAEVWIKLECNGDPQPMYTHIGVETTLTPNLANTQDLCDFFGGGIATLITSEYTYAGGHVLWGQAGDPYRVDCSAAVAGSYAGSACPQNTSLLIQKQTALAGRKGRGRMFIPGIPEGQVAANGVLSSGYRASAQAVMNAWLELTDGVSSLSLFHPITAPNVVYNLAVANVVATQRRRLRR